MCEAIQGTKLLHPEFSRADGHRAAGLVRGAGIAQDEPIHGAGEALVLV